MVAGCGAACEEGAAEVYSLITGNGTDAAAGEFALMGMTSEIKRLRIPKIDAIKSGTTDIASHCTIELTSREALENHKRAYYDGPWLSLGGLCKYIQVAKKTTDAVSKEIDILQATSIRGLDA
ncbi:hypothetical protein Tco_0499332 [Tanacetum coccineum]